MAGRSVVLFCLYFGILCQILAFSAAQDQVDQACSNDDVPMCAQSTGNGMYFLFRNECDLRKAQRSNLMGAPICKWLNVKILVDISVINKNDI